MKMHHVGIVVDNIERHLRTCEGLGLHPISPIVTDPIQKVRVQFLAAGNTKDEASIQLIQPAADGSPIANALKKGGGINHICFEVADINKSVEVARFEGGRVISEPVLAAAFHNRMIAFLFYRGIGVVELLEAPTLDTTAPNSNGPAKREPRPPSTM